MAILVYVVAATVLFSFGMIFAFLGGLIYAIAALVFAMLKFADVLIWSWQWTLLPLWAAAGVAAGKIEYALHHRRTLGTWPS